MKYDVKFIIKNMAIENNINQIYAKNNCGFINKFLLHFIESNEYIMVIVIMISLILTTSFRTDYIQFYKFVCKNRLYLQYREFLPFTYERQINLNLIHIDT